MKIVGQMVMRLIGRERMMKLLKVAVSRLFCLKRIEMEKNGFLYFSSSKTNNPSGQYFTVCPKKFVFESFARQILSNLLFTGSNFLKNI